MIQPGQTTPITGAITGYLPAARTAEFQDESAGATTYATVKPAKQYAEPSNHPNMRKPPDKGARQ